MSRIIGIDLGTTNSLVATVDSGIPLVIAGQDGKRLTPSVVHLSVAGQPTLVGEPAARLRSIKPAETIYSVKRFIGRRGLDISREERDVNFPVSGEGAAQVSFEMNGRSWTPEAISAEILKKLKADAEKYFGEPVTRAVISVPAYFNDAQRTATKQAGELAGFTVERIINEPTAAALAYGLDRLKEHTRIAVFDLGGGTFDFSILELHQGVFQVLATNGNTLLGGDDVDRRVTEFLLQKIAGAGGPSGLSTKLRSDLNPAQLSLLARVREAAEDAKIALSTQMEVDLSLPFLTPNFSFACKLTRSELEGLSRDIIARTRVHCLRALADAKLEAKDLDQVILVGGQTRMPLVREFVRDLFHCADFQETRGELRLGAEYHRREGPELNTSQNPEEAVALGAAIQAEILSGGLRNILLLDVTPLSLGLETFGGLMNVIIPRNSTIPVKAGEMFTTAVDQQREMLIHVLQGERERAKDNWSLGRFTLQFEPAPRGFARIGVQFELDANGLLHVLARDTKTGQERKVEIKSAVDVADEAVQEMVEQSVAHAFEDLAVRRWVEARLKAQQLLDAAHKALGACAQDFDSQYQEQVRQAISTVEAQINSQTAEGNLQQLQAACRVLDEVTRPMAELLMDRAMEALLKKRGVIK